MSSDGLGVVTASSLLVQAAGFLILHETKLKTNHILKVGYCHQDGIKSHHYKPQLH
jgi:hypothetical protein